MAVTPIGYAQLLVELDALIPRIICHPEDEDAVRQAVAASDRAAQVEVTELATPGNIMIFRGERWPVSDLGVV